MRQGFTVGLALHSQRSSCRCLPIKGLCQHTQSETQLSNVSLKNTNWLKYRDLTWCNVKGAALGAPYYLCHNRELRRSRRIDFNLHACACFACIYAYALCVRLVSGEDRSSMIGSSRVGVPEACELPAGSWKSSQRRLVSWPVSGSSALGSISHRERFLTAHPSQLCKLRLFVPQSPFQDNFSNNCAFPKGLPGNSEWANHTLYFSKVPEKQSKTKPGTSFSLT